MSIPASTVDSVKDYLLAQITTAVNDPAVLVSYDEPGKNLPDDVIYTGEIRQAARIESFVGTGGQHWLMETYTQQVLISVFRGGDTASLPWKRAKAIADLIDNTVVRADPSLGGRVLVAFPSRHDYKTEWAEGNKGYLVTCDMDITVEAQI